MLKKEVIEKMQDIAENCMGEEKAGCVATCPMHTDVKEYIRLLREGKGEEALKVVRNDLFLPGTLGRICPHGCEKNCKWNENNSPMSIAGLKRYIADHYDDESLWDLEIKDTLKGKSVGIIGSGPSGLQAAIELRKQGADVTVYEKEKVRGGMLSIGIPKYRLPRDVVNYEVSYLDKLGVNFEVGCEVGKDITLSELKAKYDSVIIAAGKHMGCVDLSLNNVNAKGIYAARNFLHDLNIHNEATEVGKHVLVVGGGDVAMDCCRVAWRLDGVESVDSICLEENFDKMASSNLEIRGAIEEGINFHHAKAIKEIVVDDNNNIQKVVLKKCLSMFDDQKNFAPTFDENDTEELNVDTIIFAIGQRVDNTFGEDLPVRKNSTFECNPLTLQTSDEQVFVCGDASGQSAIVVQAMATGRRAAESVKRYLLEEDLTKDRKLSDTSSYRTKLDIPTDWSKIEGQRCSENFIDVKDRYKNFTEVNKGYTEEQAMAEANRCRQCQCRKCMKECIMLNDYTDCPKTLFKRYLEEGYDKVDKMIAFSCNQCNQCTLVCPKDFRLGDHFRAIKEQLNTDNNEVNVVEELRDCNRTQEIECSDEYSTTVLAPKGKDTKYLFVPGCTVSAYRPDLMEKIMNHLRETLDGEVGALLTCCGKVTKLIGQNETYRKRNEKAVKAIDETNADVIITVCPSCYKVYQETCDKPVIAYWDLMHEKIGIPKGQKGVGKNSDVVFNIHDSCVTRDVSSHHESVRWILDELGYKYESVEREKGNTRCCGVGGMVCNSNPNLYERVYTRRASDLPSQHVVSYCGSCRGTLEAAGKDSIHILDLMFNEEPYMADQEKRRGYKDENEMWERRLASKEALNNVNND